MSTRRPGIARTTGTSFLFQKNLFKAFCIGRLHTGGERKMKFVIVSSISLIGLLRVLGTGGVRPRSCLVAHILIQI